MVDKKMSISDVAEKINLEFDDDLKHAFLMTIMYKNLFFVYVL